MASGCTGRGLDWILGETSLLREWSGIGPAAQGSGGVPIAGGVQKTCRCRAEGHGLVVDLAASDLQWDLTILRVFSNLNDYDSKSSILGHEDHPALNSDFTLTHVGSLAPPP